MFTLIADSHISCWKSSDVLVAIIEEQACRQFETKWRKRYPKHFWWERLAVDMMSHIISATNSWYRSFTSCHSHVNRSIWFSAVWCVEFLRNFHACIFATQTTVCENCGENGCLNIVLHSFPVSEPVMRFVFGRRSRPGSLHEASQQHRVKGKINHPRVKK